MKAAEAMVKYLEQEGIKVVFGYPGAAVCPFYDFLSKSSVRHILVRHEQHAGHEASGYARITNKPAVCIATSGPGATNLITAIATAYADSVPMVIITGQVSSDQIGRDVFQEADVIGAAEPFVKHSFLVKDVLSLPDTFKKAFYLAGTGRKGPVLVDVPMDLQEAEIEYSYPETVSMRAYKPSSKGNSLQVKRVAAAIAESKKPLICVGGGVIAGDACEELYAFAERTDIPVVTTMMGKGAISGYDKRCFGMLGMHGVSAANKAVTDCDLILLIGARVGDRAVRSPVFLAKTTKIIHIDIDPAEIGKNISVDIPLVGDSKIILNQLLDVVEEQTHTEWIEHLNSFRKTPSFTPAETGFINPKEFISKLSDSADENTIYVADVGQNQIWSSNFFKVKKGRFLTSGGMGTMGYSVPCAIGAKLASENSPVIAVCGDGAFQMSMMELATIKQHNIPIKIVVMSNKRLGMVRELQTKLYKDNQVAVSLEGSPDFIKLAQAYDIPAFRVTDMQSAQEAIDKLVRNDGEPLLVECMVSPVESTL